MRTFELDDSNSTLVLTSDSVRDRSPYGSWEYGVDLKGHCVSCATDIRDHMPQNFAAFFDELAKLWKGWEGAQFYESLEPGLKIEAVHDGKANCIFSITICPNLGDWSASQEFRVDCGALGDLAEKARSFVDSKC